MKNTHAAAVGVGLSPPIRAPRPTGSSGSAVAEAVKLPERTEAPLPIKAWNAAERPRERLMAVGAEALSTAELLAILLRSGTTEASAWDVARELLRGAAGRLRELSTYGYKDLARVRGVGAVKAVTLLAALELGRRRSVEPDAERPVILTSEDAFERLRPMLSDLRHEESWVLLLNNASRLVRRERLSSGGIGGTVVDVRRLYALALRYEATGVILAHNHPSGSLAPSEADRVLTRQLVAAGRVLDVHFGDHLIVAGRRYFSFRDAKLL